MTSFKALSACCCILSTISALALADLPRVKTAAKVAPVARKPLLLRPQNEAVALGEQVTLVCEADGEVPDVRVQWFEYATVGSRQQISDNGIITPGHPNANRFAIIQPDRPSQFYLVLSGAVFNDGGTYECVDANSGQPNPYRGQAELIVIDPNTNCTTNVPSNGVVRETQNFTNECIINYRGGMPPTTEWIGPEPFNRLLTVGPDTIFTGVAFTVRRDMDTRNFQLHINFTELLGTPEETASNAPAYNRIDAFSQLFVYWAPINLYAAPLKPTYEVGDTLTCYADARPNPVYQWQNMFDLSVISSQIFTITPNMVGMNVQLRCTAQNIIQGLVFSNTLFIFVDVPAPTTPAPSTTPALTTTPPLDAPCNDLSGWWLSSSPYAELNLMVSPDLSGRVTGGLRNFTDQYTVEVVGRTRVSDYAFLGLSLIYPFNKGIIGMSGECHRCSGVEMLVVESVWRSITDSAGCGDGGSPAPSTAYTFRRWDGGLTPGGGISK